MEVLKVKEMSEMLAHIQNDWKYSQESKPSAQGCYKKKNKM